MGMFKTRWQHPTSSRHLQFKSSVSVVSGSTYIGLVETEEDARQLVRYCRSGRLHPTPPGPYRCEITDFIRDGNVFVLQGDVSCIEPWIDPERWRLVGQDCGFNIYYSLDGNLTAKKLNVIEGFQVISYYESYPEELKKIDTIDQLREITNDDTTLDITSPTLELGRICEFCDRISRIC
jgi:hypothetical protein